jgi:serine protease Do
MFEPWRQQGGAQAAATHTRPARVRPTTIVLLLALVAVAWPWLARPEPELQHAQDRRVQPVLAPTGDLLAAFELARPATLRIEARCVTPFGGRQVLGVGTGFFFAADGSVMTAYHVIDASGSAADCPVSYVGIGPDRGEYALDLVGFDAYMDLAVMRARVDGLVPFVPLAGALPQPGTAVVAIGNSRGDFLAARAGRVTRLGVRAGRADFADDTIELTNALAPGDSGGPVVTTRGEVVGVVSYISTNPGGMRSDAPLPPFLMGLPLPREFAAYAVPVEVGSTLVASVVAGDQRDVPVIGFTWQQGYDYDPDRSDVDLGPRPGPVVSTVAPGGPASRAGLRPFEVLPVLDAEGNRVGSRPDADVIVAVDGVPTPTFAALLAVVRGKEIGQVIELTVQRGAATFKLPLELGARRQVFTGSR